MKKPKRMTDDALKKLALAYIEGRTVVDQDVPKPMWVSVFMPILFMTDAKKHLRGVRMIVGDPDGKMPMGVNGFPIFSSVYMLKRPDTRRFVEYVERLKKERAEFMKPS